MMTIGIACADRDVEGAVFESTERTSVNFQFLGMFMTDVKFSQAVAVMENPTNINY